MLLEEVRTVCVYSEREVVLLAVETCVYDREAAVYEDLRSHCTFNYGLNCVSEDVRHEDYTRGVTI